ncbi:MAG TPA: rod shape-determining protein MreC [Thermoleophilaceae bacterium]|nr:rod shape-determining protein MreC [Thermoleophilaceae bacterium]
MYDKKVVRRRRAVLGVLVAVSLGLLTVYFGENGGGILHSFQNGTSAVFSPLEKGVSIVFKPVSNFTHWTGDVFHAKKENKQLKQQVQQLQTELAQSQTAERDAAELRSLVGLPRTSNFAAGDKLVTARVISRSPTVWYSNVVINAGSGSGVHIDDPVIAAGGLAGKVTSLTGGEAIVTLITDESSAVSAEVMPDGSNGIVRPEVGNPNDMLLDYVDKGANIHKGDSVVTSGFTSSKLDSLFPRGIPIGKVTKVSPSEVEQYQRVHMRPYADLRRMNYVQVLTGNAQDQRAQVVK